MIATPYEVIQLSDSGKNPMLTAASLGEALSFVAQEMALGSDKPLVIFGPGCDQSPTTKFGGMAGTSLEEAAQRYAESGVLPDWFSTA